MINLGDLNYSQLDSLLDAAKVVVHQRMLSLYHKQQILTFDCESLGMMFRDALDHITGALV